MITKTQAYQTSDGKAHATIESAQKHELTALLSTKPIAGGDPLAIQVESVVDVLIASAAQVADILTMKSTSKPRARKVNKTKAPTT